MKSLTAYFGNRGKICPMMLLVDGELKRNAMEVTVIPFGQSGLA